MRTFTVDADTSRVEMFVPLAKFDQRTGEFEGWATVEEVDGHGEICDVERSWPAIAGWSSEQIELSKGRSAGNVRVQHRRNSVGGKLTLVEQDERNGAPGVRVSGVITDEKAKSDAAEGVLTGLSFRGLCARWPDGALEGVKRYAWAEVEECSLVDRPAVRQALIEVMKSDGHVEMVKALGRTKTVTQYWSCGVDGCSTQHARKEEAAWCDAVETEKAHANQYTSGGGGGGKTKSEEEDMDVEKILTSPRFVEAVKAAAGEYGDVAYADEVNKKYPIDTATHVRSAWSYIAKKKNTEAYSADEVKTIRKRIVSAWRRLIDREGPPSAAKALVVESRKSLYSVSSLAQCLACLQGCASDVERNEMYEAMEGKGDPAAGAKALAAVRAAVSATFDALEAMIADERIEFEGDDEGDESAADVEMAMAESMRVIRALSRDKLSALAAPKTDEEEQPMSPEEKQQFDEMQKSLKASQETNAAEIVEIKTALGAVSESVLALHDSVKQLFERPGVPRAAQRMVPVSKSQDTTTEGDEEKKPKTPEEQLSPRHRTRIA